MDYRNSYEIGYYLGQSSRNADFWREEQGIKCRMNESEAIAHSYKLWPLYNDHTSAYDYAELRKGFLDGYIAKDLI